MSKESYLYITIRINRPMYSEDTHITKNRFFHILEQRLIEYHEALMGTQQILGVRQHMMSCTMHHLNTLKRLDDENQLFGGDFWGYGINTFSDGVQSLQHPDVQQIKMVGGLNKRNDPTYRNFLLLSFKIENDALLVSTFIIDTCSTSMQSDINTRFPLKHFEYAKTKNRGQAVFVEFIFTGVEKPISFQLETYHIGWNHLNGGQLAQYYISGITKRAQPVKVKTADEQMPDFLKDFIDGIHTLQEEDINAECIRVHRVANQKNESSFRNWFRTWFKARGYQAEAEPEKGLGYIDLKVLHATMAPKIIEFKGWWNNDRDAIVQQLGRYLTQFQGDAYVFMINHNKSLIDEKYKELITAPALRYVTGTWESHTFKNTPYTYYRSQHVLAQGVKWVYHFIFPVHIS